MPNLIYLYTTGGANGGMNRLPSVCTVDYTSRSTNNRYAIAAQYDGMIKMFGEIPNHTSHIEHTYIFIDSVSDPGRLVINSHCDLFVVPHIALALNHIHPDDIVVVRGGFRNWIPTITQIHDARKNWILFYRANTAHGHWPYWDITLNDLIDKPTPIKHGIQVPFNKPVNESVFGYIDSPNVIHRDVDIMIGASHIHRKKGQCNVIKALEYFYATRGYAPKSILPGGFIRSIENSYIQSIINKPEINIVYAGPVKRPQLSMLMNHTKLFIHAGTGGQNDRSTLEAMACGCEVIITNPKSVAPFVRDNATIAVNSPEAISNIVYSKLSYYSTNASELAANYKRCNGLYNVSIPQITGIVDFISNNPVSNRDVSIQELVS